MTDRYGIPPNFFGLVPEDFYGLIGRTVLLATLLEDKVLGLLWTLDDAPQDEHAGKPAGGIIRLCRARLDRLDASFRAEVASFVDAAEESLNFRNAVVHSLWVSSEATDSRGWRNLRKSARDKATPEDWARWIDTSHEELATRLQASISLVQQCNQLQVLVASHRIDGKPL